MHTGDYSELGDFLLHESAHRHAGSSIIAFDAWSFHCLDGENWKSHSSCTSMGLRRWEFPIKIILCKRKSLNIIYGTLEGYSIFNPLKRKTNPPKSSSPTRSESSRPNLSCTTQDGFGLAMVEFHLGQAWIWIYLHETGVGLGLRPLDKRPRPQVGLTTNF